jgi:hypothetical protein
MSNHLYVKNIGTTSETVFLNNDKISKQNIGWDADYDGNEANVSVDVQDNGAYKHYDVNLTNEDLANILNIQSVGLPIHQRLKNDFKGRTPKLLYNIYLDDEDTLDIEEPNYVENNKPSRQLLEHPTHISSPLSDEEFIIPVTIGNKSSFTPRRRHKKIKSHKIHKIYKKRKTNTNSSLRRKRESHRNTRSRKIHSI